jgi:hypothetical protein
MLSTVVLLTLWASAAASAIPVEQQPLADLSTDSSTLVLPDHARDPPAEVAGSGPRGRFLHITGTYWAPVKILGLWGGRKLD